jgi:hypothetical protein
MKNLDFPSVCNDFFHLMIAEVRLWDMVVGHLSLDENRITSVFRFDADFLKKGLDLAPILMPLSSMDHSRVFTFVPEDNTDFRTYKGLPEFISDSLPDSFGNKVMNAWLVKQGKEVSDFTSIERLCYTGKRGVGALEYFPLLGGKDEITDVSYAYDPSGFWNKRHFLGINGKFENFTRQDIERYKNIFTQACACH